MVPKVTKDPTIEEHEDIVPLDLGM